MATSMYHPLSDEPKYTHLPETLKPHTGHFSKKTVTPVRIQSDEANPNFKGKIQPVNPSLKHAPKPPVSSERTVQNGNVHQDH